MSKRIYIAQFHAKHLNCARCTSISRRGSSKTPLLTTGSRSSTGGELQTVGPPTEKARRPSVLRRYRGKIKRCRLADRRCLQATTATGVQQLLCFPDTDGPWLPTCTPRVQERWASGVGRESALTDRGRTCECRWRGGPQLNSTIHVDPLSKHYRRTFLFDVFKISSFGLELWEQKHLCNHTRA